MEPVAAPKTAVNSLIALVMGGPVGFEAALTGVIGGTASWISRPIGTVRQLVREAWGADRVESVPSAVRHLPSWLAALSGLLTYHWLPFGSIDLGFRFQQFDGTIGVEEGLAVFALAAAVVVPAAWAISVVMRAEHSTFSKRSPVLIGMAGGVVFACMALGNDLVLFSGQQGIQLLPDESTGALLYITVAKWLALVVALTAGWRGGPIFPTYTAVAALGVLVDEVVGVGPDLLMIAGIAAVSVVFLKGNIPLAALLTLYPVPLSYAGVILVGCVGGAVGLAVARSLHALPSPSAEPPPSTA
jgi:chloride channel protein, CIC family